MIYNIWYVYSETESNEPMRIIQTLCTVHYTGRGDTVFDPSVRLVIVKSDGSVMIHRDKGLKPINYMTNVKDTDEYDSLDDLDGGELRPVHHLVVSSKTETIDVSMFEIYFDMELDFPEDDRELKRKGTEKQLQAWLSIDANFEKTFGPNCSFLTREWFTGKGNVDLLGLDSSDGQVMLIEVKRIAKRNDVFQVTRYRTALRELHEYAVSASDDEVVTTQSKGAFPVAVSSIENPHAILIASKLKDGVRDECEKQGVIAIELGYGWTKDVHNSIDVGNQGFAAVVGEESAATVADEKVAGRGGWKNAANAAGESHIETVGSLFGDSVV